MSFRELLVEAQECSCDLGRTARGSAFRCEQEQERGRGGKDPFDLAQTSPGRRTGGFDTGVREVGLSLRRSKVAAIAFQPSDPTVSHTPQ